jgi:hypothetical protein
MAKQDGIIPIKGSIDKLSFYQSRDGYMARKRHGVDPARLAKDPAYVRTREAMSNFGKAGAAGKLLRTALRPLVKQASDKRVVGRLVAQLVQVIKSDQTNPRGKKNIIDGETELLKGFEFNTAGKLSVTFAVQYEALIDRASGALQVKIPAFVPAEMVTAPFEATHMQLHIAGLEVDFENQAHVAQFKSSEQLPLGETQQPAIDLSVALPAASTHPLFLALAITFSTQDVGVYYPLKNGTYNALAIVKVSGV